MSPPPVPEEAAATPAVPRRRSSLRAQWCLGRRPVDPNRPAEDDQTMVLATARPKNQNASAISQPFTLPRRSASCSGAMRNTTRAPRVKRWDGILRSASDWDCLRRVRPTFSPKKCISIGICANQQLCLVGPRVVAFQWRLSCPPLCSRALAAGSLVLHPLRHPGQIQLRSHVQSTVYRARSNLPCKQSIPRIVVDRHSCFGRLSAQMGNLHPTPRRDLEGRNISMAHHNAKLLCIFVQEAPGGGASRSGICQSAGQVAAVP
jgi:hypothetical protein